MPKLNMPVANHATGFYSEDSLELILEGQILEGQTLNDTIIMPDESIEKIHKGYKT